jgi:hypothetical protein
MCQRRLQGMTAEVVYRGTTFTVAKATSTDNGKTIVAEGISRRSSIDAPDQNMGEDIAIGRAKRALWNKINHKGNRSRMKG